MDFAINPFSSLPNQAVGYILMMLPQADRRRLGSTCCRLQYLYKDTVKAVVLSQQDLEQCAEEALAAFPQAEELQLTGVAINEECILALASTAHTLLQRLKVLQVLQPVSLDVTVLLQLASACPRLTQLCVDGSWDCNSSDNAQAAAQVWPQQLSRLSLLRNSQLDPAQLHALLSLPNENSVHSSCRCNSSSSSSGDSPTILNTASLPLWCRVLGSSACLESSCSSNSRSGSTAAMLAPALLHLTALDLTASPKIGASLQFMALCPALLSLTLHSCFKVTDATLQELSSALSSIHTSSNHGDHSPLPGSAPVNSSHPVGDLNTNGTNGSSATSFTAEDQRSSHGESVPLQQLDLSYTRVKDAGMLHLAAALPNLAWLSLKGCNVGDDGLQHLLRLQHLTAFHIKHCHRVTDEGILGLSSLSGLRSLSYGYTSMPEADDVAAAIGKQFKHLTGLDLLASELTDTGVAELGRLSELQELKLYQAGVTGQGLAALATTPAGAGLHSLVLYGTGALQELTCLGGFPALQQLQLGRLCDLSAHMAEALLDLTTVQHLTALTLERMDDLTVGALQHIMKGCRALLLLRVRGCDGVCQDDMEELAQDAATVCGSSTSVWWAASPSCDTDDEEEGWEMLQP